MHIRLNWRERLFVRWVFFSFLVPLASTAQDFLHAGDESQCWEGDAGATPSRSSRCNGCRGRMACKLGAKTTKRPLLGKSYHTVPAGKGDALAIDAFKSH